ncbi:MAG: cupin domain-containing protein [Roseivirga sp.]|nr:cupin domain-containing protein [Roseivirga sp.]
MKHLNILVLPCLLLLFACQGQQTESVTQEPPSIDEPIFVDSKGGKTWNIFGLQIIGKVFSEDTNGAYSVIISTTPPDGGAPPHIHEIEDELFYVLEGEFSFTCGEETFLAKKGAVVVLPKGIPHAFKNTGGTTGRMMNTITPGGFEEFFEEVDRLPKNGPPDPVVLSELAMKYKLRFIQAD